MSESQPTPQIPQFVSRDALGFYLSVSLPTLARYIKMPGAPKGQGHPKKRVYELAPWIEFYVNLQVTDAIKKVEHSSVSLDEKTLKRQSLSMDIELKRRTIDEKDKNLVAISDVIKERERWLTIVRQSLQAAPSRFAPYLIAKKDETEAREALLLQVHKLMKSMKSIFATNELVAAEDAEHRYADDAAEKEEALIEEVFLEPEIIDDDLAGLPQTELNDDL